MLDLFPEGFEEAGSAEVVELAGFADEAGAARARAELGEVTVEPVGDRWEDEWKRFHQPVTVGSLWIGPPWETAPSGVTAVVIDPGRAFGTGAHPTTQLCLDLLDDLERGALLDVGCGSGVLAIAACKLGFGPVVAIDSDEAAVEATRRNAAANGVEVEERHLNAKAGPLPDAEIAAANIDLATLAALPFPASCGTVVASGYYAVDAPVLTGFQRSGRRVRDGWAADRFSRE